MAFHGSAFDQGSQIYASETSNALLGQADLQQSKVVSPRDLSGTAFATPRLVSPTPKMHTPHPAYLSSSSSNSVKALGRDNRDEAAFNVKRQKTALHGYGDDAVIDDVDCGGGAPLPM